MTKHRSSAGAIRYWLTLLQLLYLIIAPNHYNLAVMVLREMLELLDMFSVVPMSRVPIRGKTIAGDR